MKIFSLTIKVRSYECDSYGHVNNAVYLNYLEYARMSALAVSGFTLDTMKKRGYLVVIRKIEIEYKYPLFMNDEIIIDTFTSETKRSSGTFIQQITNKTRGHLSAEAKVTWVFTDTKGKPIPIPSEIREAFEMDR
jgi:acyl-CoA thioester hydrolase